MRARGGIVDVHYTEALYLVIFIHDQLYVGLCPYKHYVCRCVYALMQKNIVSEVQRQSMGNDSVDTQEYNPPLESVVNCPRQCPES
ncbi:hypothetical protein HYC85_000036 [Camellia sinensis]|uniref:Uncharacterized protein n=1 Tax=Camellia sinensis TaxID=4442 RepID=A0A7J7FSD0_CAMSI|nr:hypothetical protein HYC85_000036 [Camellia sinensis]